jgi:hypothetical protein
MENTNNSDNTILKKRLSAYRSAKGRIKSVPDDLLLAILRAWEQWPGTAGNFYSSLGSTHRQMAKLMGKAKKLVREGRVVDESEFKEISLESGPGSLNPCQGIELLWEGGRVIRFSQVEPLLEFLKKAA